MLLRGDTPLFRGRFRVVTTAPTFRKNYTYWRILESYQLDLVSSTLPRNVLTKGAKHVVTTVAEAVEARYRYVLRILRRRTIRITIII